MKVIMINEFIINLACVQKIRAVDSTIAILFMGTQCPIAIKVRNEEEAKLILKECYKIMKEED